MPLSRSFGVESRALPLVERCVMYEWAELRHFRYLLAILERQGLRAAAEELRTAQPNLSVQARQFQENASVRLFRKMKGGRILPTDTRVAFKVLARFLLETHDEVLNALIAIERGEVNSVRFGCTPLVDHALFRTFCDLHKEILPVCPVRPTHGDTAQLAEVQVNLIPHERKGSGVGIGEPENRSPALCEAYEALPFALAPPPAYAKGTHRHGTRPGIRKGSCHETVPRSTSNLQVEIA
jgi:DNA-binding transcriptional LysR family regulator